jgi:hypothetical protein
MVNHFHSISESEKKRANEDGITSTRSLTSSLTAAGLICGKIFLNNRRIRTRNDTDDDDEGNNNYFVLHGTNHEVGDHPIQHETGIPDIMGASISFGLTMFVRCQLQLFHSNIHPITSNRIIREERGLHASSYQQWLMIPIGWHNDP